MHIYIYTYHPLVLAPPKKNESRLFSCRKWNGAAQLRGWGEEEARLMDLDSDQKVTFEAAGVGRRTGWGEGGGPSQSIP